MILLIIFIDMTKLKMRRIKNMLLGKTDVSLWLRGSVDDGPSSLMCIKEHITGRHQRTDNYFHLLSLCSISSTNYKSQSAFLHERGTVNTINWCGPQFRDKIIILAVSSPTGDMNYRYNINYKLLFFFYCYSWIISEFLRSITQIKTSI